MIRTNPFKQRASQNAKRRRAVGAVAKIATAESQHLQNVQRAAQASSDAKLRQERVEKQRREQEAQEALRKVALAAHQATAARAAAAKAGVVESEARAQSTTSSRVRPSAEEAFIAAQSKLTDEQRAVFFEALQAKHSSATQVSFWRVHEQVGRAHDTAVLRAADDGGGVQTWDTLPSTGMSTTGEGEREGEERLAAWRRWLTPANWRGFVDMCGEVDDDEVGDGEDGEDDTPMPTTRDVEMVAFSGAYNAVVGPASTADLEDATRWPPQLLARGKDRSYVVRLTKKSPFKSTKAKAPVYRFGALSDVILEMALTLHAASIGVGPPVLAALTWPVKVGKDKPPVHGLLLVLERADGDMIDFQYALDRRFPRPSYVCAAPPAYTVEAAAAAADVARLCYRSAKEGFVNFDIKPANLLLCSGGESRFHLCDFDPMHFVQLPTSVSSEKTCFFMNMLLICMHVRSNAKNDFAAAFLNVLSPMMFALWREAVHDPAAFGAGADTLTGAQFPADAKCGYFCARELHATTDFGMRQRRHFEMMFFEYSFSKAEGRKPPEDCVRWPHWRRQSGTYFAQAFLLVPQLMRYCFFYAKPVPPELASLLGAEKAPR